MSEEDEQLREKINIDDSYGIDANFFKEVQDASKGAILEKQLLKSKDEREELIVAYKLHTREQLKIENLRERTFLIDKYGATVCLIITPKKLVKKGKLLNPLELCKNKSYRLWGFNLVLMGTTNKNTMFGDSKSALVGYNQKILARGSMTKKYKYGAEKAMFENTFVKFMKGIYEGTEDKEGIKPDREVNSLDDIDFIDYFDDFTFNIWETLIHWGRKSNE